MDIIFQIFIISFGFYSISWFKRQVRKSDIKVLNWLWCYHIIFGLVYGSFFTGDAIYYWEGAKAMTHTEFLENLTTKFGTFFILSFNYFPAGVLNFSYMSGTLMHTYMGFLGLCCYYALAIQLIPKNSYLGNLKLFPFLFFLPNLHFWTVSVGKDSTSFFFTALIFYALFNLKNRIPLIIIGFLFLYLIRPHVALFAFIAIGGAYLISPQVTKAQRIILSLIILSMAIVILPKVLEYSNIDSLSTENIDNFTSERSGNLSREHISSRIDLSTYPFPLKVFTFLFRPLFFDVTSVTAILASFENLILLLTTIKVIRNKPIQAYKAAPLVIQAMLLFLILGTIAFAQTLSNLGIMLRMRNMFLPAFILFLLWSLAYLPKKKS